MTGNACFSSFHLKECICVFFSLLCSLKWRLAATSELFVCYSAASINLHQFTSVNKQAQSQRNAQENMLRWGVAHDALSERMKASLLSNITHSSFSHLLPLSYFFSTGPFVQNVSPWALSPHLHWFTHLTGPVLSATTTFSPGVGKLPFV